MECEWQLWMLFSQTCPQKSLREPYFPLSLPSTTHLHSIQIEHLEAKGTQMAGQPQNTRTPESRACLRKEPPGKAAWPGTFTLDGSWEVNISWIRPQRLGGCVLQPITDLVKNRAKTFLTLGRRTTLRLYLQWLLNPIQCRQSATFFSKVLKGKGKQVGIILTKSF